jgi:3'(2'), 5'-bisphosphate nucleotidase
MTYDSQLKVAVEAVKKAAQLSQAVRRNLVESDTVRKGDRSPVTVADLGCQAVISLSLLKEFPGYTIIGEEGTEQMRASTELREKVVKHVRYHFADVSEGDILQALDYGAWNGGCAERFWTLDPIDGTKGFLRGDQYAIALALVENGEVVLGILGCPNLPVSAARPDLGRGCLLHAAKGEGSYQQSLITGEEHQIAVDGVEDCADARFCESVEPGHAAHDVHATISRALGLTKEPFRIDSQAKYAAVARGDASIYLRLSRSEDYREKIWDHAAGTIVVEEAGGTVSDFSGDRLDFSCGTLLERNIGIVGTNGRLHSRVLEAIQEVVR